MKFMTLECHLQDTIDTLRVAKSDGWVQEAVDKQDRLASDKEWCGKKGE